jgi:hypothetical protein
MHFFQLWEVRMKLLRKHRYLVAACVIALVAPANEDLLYLSSLAAFGACCAVYYTRLIDKALYVFFPAACYCLGSMHIVIDQIAKK